jgi:hypothetical protein
MFKIMKKRIIIPTFIFVIVALATSCKKECSQPLNNPISTGCSEIYPSRTKNAREVYGSIIQGYFPNTRCLSGLYYKNNDKYTYGQPSINPQNGDEFLFLRVKNDWTTWEGFELCIYNFCTNSIRIVTNHVGYSPDWSIKDWIIFTGTDFQLWKIKSNSDSLTKLTNTMDYNNSAIWSLNGEKILYYDASQGSNCMKIADKNGIEIQRFYKAINSWTWLSDTTIIYSLDVVINNLPTTYIEKYNLNTRVSENISTLTTSGCNNLINKDGVIYFTGIIGIHKLVNNNPVVVDTSFFHYQTSKGIPFGDNYYLRQITINDTIGYDSCIGYHKTFFSLLDKRDKKDLKVLIPE